ncbi:hypothetical protein BH10PSE18_BH10PSE18_13700 [soil metagenome]
MTISLQDSTRPHDIDGLRTSASELPTHDALLARLEGLADAFNRHDADAVLSFFADDCVMELPQGPDPWGRRCVGRAAVHAGVSARFAGLPDVHYGNVAHCVVGQLGISRWTVSGTTPAGESVCADGCDFYFFDTRARVTRKDSYWKIVQKPSMETQPR